ncbi:MAG: hypothetical protein U0Z70_19495 [Thermomicrobiales bacterium]
MGKRFVTRARQDWEALLAPDTEPDEVRASASRWLASRLDGYVQSTPDAPVTLAVPDRFLEMLGDATATMTPAARDGQRARPRPERPVH